MNLPWPRPIRFHRELFDEWREQAACKDRWFVMEPDLQSQQGILAARRVCWMCPVLDDCRRWATSLTSNDDKSGAIIAATTPSERRKERTPHAEAA